MNDDCSLQRFINAQDPVYDDALAMLRAGSMCTPYIDFIFPRLLDRGADPASSRYAITSLDEARDYLASPVLGGRYRECITSLTRVSAGSAAEVFGAEDAKKLHASLTLFAEAVDEHLLRVMLVVWFDSLLEQDTMSELERRAAASA